MNFLFLLLQDPPAGDTQAPASQGGSMLFWIIGIFAIFYFLMIRPQMKEQKKRREMLGQLKKNDRVVTNGGMYGQIVNITDDEVTLKIDDNSNVRARFTRSAITGLAMARNKTEKSD